MKARAPKAHRVRNGCKYIATTVIHVALELAQDKPGVFIDVGAFQGFEAAQALDAGRRTVSLECSLDPFYELVGRNTENGDCLRTPCCLLDDALKNGSAAVLHACASAETRLGTVHVGEDASSLFAGNVPDRLRRQIKGPTTHAAVVVPLDELLPTERVAVIKIDAQGSEYDVLVGASRMLARDLPVIVYEWENELPSNFDAHSRKKGISLRPWHLLRALGYNCTKDFSPVPDISFLSSDRSVGSRKPDDLDLDQGHYGADWLCLVRDGSARQEALLDLLACRGACARNRIKRGRVAGRSVQ